MAFSRYRKGGCNQWGNNGFCNAIKAARVKPLVACGEDKYAHICPIAFITFDNLHVNLNRPLEKFINLHL